MSYYEPELTYLVLDFQKEAESRACLESIRRHTLFEHKVIYLHNGEAPYPAQFLKDGLIDTLIQTKRNTGLGIGTRDLFAASFSPWSFYLQNDQHLKRDFTGEEFREIVSLIGQDFRSPHDGSVWKALSVDLAGGFCGMHTYSERGHIIRTDFYKKMESEGWLGYFGAGPYYGDRREWREGRIQRYYAKEKYLHYTYTEPLVADDGHRAVRENPDGSLWEHRADTQELRLLKGPVRERAPYPHFTETEWDEVLRTSSWPEWKIPERDLPKSFRIWH